MTRLPCSKRAVADGLRADRSATSADGCRAERQSGIRCSWISQAKTADASPNDAISLRGFTVTACGHARPDSQATTRLAVRSQLEGDRDRMVVLQS
jgi:hypothetical protein